MLIASHWRRLAVVATVALILAWSSAAIAQQSDGDATDGATVEALQKRMLADPQMSSAVMALRDNPQVQAILNDPALAAALSRGDLATLMADPKVKRLADDPAVRDLGRQVSP